MDYGKPKGVHFIVMPLVYDVLQLCRDREMTPHG